MDYSVTFIPTFVNHTFKRYQDVVVYNKRHPEDNVLAEYNQVTKSGFQDYLYGDPRLKDSKPRKASSKYCHSSNDYRSFARAEKFATCMDIAHDKGCTVGKYPVLDTDPTVDFCHYPQGFDPDVSLAPVSIFQIWKDCSPYRQVSAGITHLFRNVIIVDIDNKDGSVTVPLIHQTIQAANLPCPNYIITHHKDGFDTYQLGFLMENPIKVKDAEGIDTVSHGVNNSQYYISLVHKMNEVLFGDLHYSGWQVKNPYFCQNHKDFSVQWFSEEPVSSWYDIRTTLGVPLATCKLNVCASVKSLPSTNSELSRNYFLRMFIAEQVRKHQGNISEDDMISLCLSHATDFARRANKSQPQSSSEIISVTRSSFRYFMGTFHPAEGSNSSSKYSNESRSCSALKRSLARFYKCLSIYNLSSLGYSRSDICSNLSVPSSHFARYNLRQEQLLSQLSELLSGFNSTKFLFGSNNPNQDFWFKAIYDLTRLQKSFFQPGFVEEFVSQLAA